MANKACLSFLLEREAVLVDMVRKHFLRKLELSRPTVPRLKMMSEPFT
jgi:hypothetical protein